MQPTFKPLQTLPGVRLPSNFRGQARSITMAASLMTRTNGRVLSKLICNTPSGLPLAGAMEQQARSICGAGAWAAGSLLGNDRSHDHGSHGQSAQGQHQAHSHQLHFSRGFAASSGEDEDLTNLAEGALGDSSGMAVADSLQSGITADTIAAALASGEDDAWVMAQEGTWFPNRGMQMVLRFAQEQTGLPW